MAAGNVLVVDDDPGIREALLDILSESGFNAMGAATGEEALAALASLPLPCTDDATRETTGPYRSKPTV